ncbi:MAG TPA: hypothetical protein VHX14_15685 [Thermoanaerobaculia bacterium]|jgi:hypothetical protein|nr:hypothetical protein [Thermoanaerobaculia bacterium]
MGLDARKWLAALIVFLAACNRPPVKPVRPAANEPKIRAIVVTIQTTMPPSPKIWTHTIVIANDRARSSDELDEWRLFDFKEKTVTFVDDLSKTYRKVSFADVEAAHRASLSQQLPEGMPRAQFMVGNAQKTLQGVIAKQSTIRIGAYQRELWIASHPLIPQGLFAIMQASAPASSPLAGVMRQADEALIEIKGFPMSDHAELPYEKRKLVVDNEVVKIEQSDVAASWLNVNGAYKEVKVRPETAKSPPETK